MERATIEEFNHWWTRRIVDPALALPFRRDVLSEIERRVSKRFIIAITGLRRIGKTTILYQLIDDLIKKNIPPENLLFFSFDNATASLNDVLTTYKELHSKELRDETIYIFLDEIQKHPNWENDLKQYYDLYPKTKFFISGSESLFIRKKTKETLAGRIFEFALTPFTFKEYLRFQGVSPEQEKYESIVVPHFTEFVKKGGFPETFSFDNDKDYKDYLRALLVDTVIYKDIPATFSIEDPEFLNVLLELIATNQGMYIDYQSLSKQFGKDRRVIKEYISYLKETYLITILGNYRKGSITTLRKKKRAYPTDNALTYLYLPAITETIFGRMVETAIINKLKASSFWKNGGEVDIIHHHTPIEVKYQEQINSEDKKSITEYMETFKQSRGIIITKKEEKELKTPAGTLYLIPAWKFMLEEEHWAPS